MISSERKMFHSLLSILNWSHRTKLYIEDSSPLFPALDFLNCFRG